MSTAVLPVHIALVDDTGEVEFPILAKLAGALNEQIHDEFYKDWKVLASVGAYPASAITPGFWVVRIQKTLDQPGALGYHTDSNNQPVAYVEFTPDYSVTVSHEVLEMLVDPWGNRMHQASPPVGVGPAVFGISATDRVSYLVEACDPCESASYLVGGVALSDYMLPRWYRTEGGRNKWFSHLGTCISPRSVSDGGYVSFATPNGTWWQVFNESGKLSVQNLGSDTSAFGSLREFTDSKAREYRAANPA